MDDLPLTGMRIYGQREPDTSFPEFVMEAVPLPTESEKAGRPISRDVEMVRVYTPGDRTSVPVHKVTDEHRNRWPAQYAAFKKRGEVVHEGTALEDWPRMTPSRIHELKAMNLFTVEHVASMSDSILQRFGMGGREMREAARAFITNARDTAHAQRLAVENERMKLELQRQQQQIHDLAQQMEALLKKQEARAAPPAEPQDTYPELQGGNVKWLMQS